MRIERIGVIAVRRRLDERCGEDADSQTGTSELRPTAHTLTLMAGENSKSAVRDGVVAVSEKSDVLLGVYAMT